MQSCHHPIMSLSPFAVVVLTVLVGAICSFIHRRQASNGRRQLPPGPPKLSAIENFQLLDHNGPHRGLQKLSLKYGPIMSFKNGSERIIIISSPEAAELFLKIHETNFLNRPRTKAYDKYLFGPKGLVFVNDSQNWRSLRKLAAVELRSAAKIGSLRGMRKEEMEVVVELIKAAPPDQAVDLSETVERLIEDMTYRMVFGQKMDASGDLMAAVHEQSELIATFSRLEFVPVLAPIELQVLTARMKVLMEKIDKIMERFIDEHEHETAASQTSRKDFIGVLLTLMKKSSDKSLSKGDKVSCSIDRDGVKGVVLDTIIGAVGTSSAAIEWIMTELLRHPRVMKKVQEEIDIIVGQERRVDENDLSEFKYLEMVIKEDLRLHPVLPFLIPRESAVDVVINDYFIPKRSNILVNYWALGRDPNSWSENAEEFLPERFIDSEVDFRGRHFQFIPFGAGRRGCPGMDLGMVTTRLVVAQLVHCFNWELPNGMSPAELDVKERFGVTLSRANHLLAVPKHRLRI